MESKQTNKFLSIEPVVLALEAELEAAQLENMKLKHIIESLTGHSKLPDELYMPGKDISTKDFSNLLPEIRLPLTIKARMFREGTYTWHFIARSCKTFGDFQYGYYMNEPDLLGTGDIIGVVADLHKKVCFDLAHFYRRK